MYQIVYTLEQYKGYLTTTYYVLGEGDEPIANSHPYGTYANYKAAQVALNKVVDGYTEDTPWMGV